MTTSLLLIDLQNDYFPGGKMELEGSSAAVNQAGKLLAEFRRRQWPVLHIQHVSTRPGATFFLPDTDGIRFHAAVQPEPGETIVIKHYPNSFRDTPLLDHLRRHETKRLVMAGMMTHMCVDATVRAAFDLGFECRLAEDACATRSLVLGDRNLAAAEVHLAFLAALNGLYACVQSTDHLLAEI
jgi:nicotinamidase-related amidase